MRILLLIAAAVIAAVPLASTGSEDVGELGTPDPDAGPARYEILSGLSGILASETLCELDLDQDTIAAFIEENVSDNDLDFSSTLRGMIAVAERQLGPMTPSAQTVHCTQIRQLARAFDLID